MTNLEKITEDNKENKSWQFGSLNSELHNIRSEKLNNGYLFYTTLAIFTFCAAHILYKAFQTPIDSFIQYLIK